MQKRAMGKTICDYCGIEFEKPISELERNQKLGRRNYCSRRCCGKDNMNNIPEDKRRSYDISQHKGNRVDEYTGFREFIRRANNRHHETNMSLEYLRQLWEKQDGTCPYSGIGLSLPRSKDNSPMYTASLDRIDSSKGYVEGNVQFVSTAINWMKGSMTHEETIGLCKLIAQHWSAG